MPGATESPGWGAVLLGVAIGSAMGYGAARSGAWGASEEDAAEAANAHRASWGSGYEAGHRDGARAAFEVADREAAEHAEAEFWRGHGIGWDDGRWEERKGWLAASQSARQKAHTEAQEASARGYLRGFEAAGGAGRQGRGTWPGHG